MWTKGSQSKLPMFMEKGIQWFAKAPTYSSLQIQTFSQNITIFFPVSCHYWCISVDSHRGPMF